MLSISSVEVIVRERVWRRGSELSTTASSSAKEPAKGVMMIAELRDGKQSRVKAARCGSSLPKDLGRVSSWDCPVKKDTLERELGAKEQKQLGTEVKLQTNWQSEGRGGVKGGQTK